MASSDPQRGPSAAVDGLKSVTLTAKKAVFAVDRLKYVTSTARSRE